MAPVTTKNTSDSAPPDDTFLFVNISGPTDGPQRKPLPNRPVKVQRATLVSKGNSKNKTKHANTLDTSAVEGYSEEQRGHGNTPERGLTELQKLTTPVDSRLDRHPLAVLYQSLASSSKFPAYSLAYVVMQNVKLNRKPRGTSFSLFSTGIILTSQQVREMVLPSPEQSIMIALQRFTDFALQDLTQARCHLDGLIMMVDSRGGYSSFSQKPDIRLMIFCPRFPQPAALLPARLRTGTSAIWDLLRFVKEIECQPDVEQNALFDALREISSIAKTIKSEFFTRGDAAWHDSLLLSCLGHLAAHRLLSTLEKGCENQDLPISTSIRLGIALFLIILKQRSRGCPAPSTPYVAKAVSVFYWDIPNIPLHMSSSLFTLRLWLLLLCAIACPDTALLPESRILIMRIKKQSSLNSWEEVVARARLMPRISKFESRKGFGNY
ncbi:hypothetical protein V8C34DRAFT_324751 [Trichoderma compactum]